MTIDTTVTNGRFVGPNGVFEHSISIHDGRVLETPEFEDVWRTIDASGHLVLPGMLQYGKFSRDEKLTLARRGTTTLLVPGHPGRATAMDFLEIQAETPGILRATDPDAVARAQAGEGMLKVPVSLLHGPDSEQWWHVVRDSPFPVHVTHGGEPGFPLLQFLFHHGELSPERIAEVTSVMPARWYGLHPAKGTFDVGSHGDVIIFDPASNDPYHESPWPGRVIMSLQRGDMLLYNGQIHSAPGTGHALKP